MARRSRILSGLLVSSALLAATFGVGGLAKSAETTQSLAAAPAGTHTGHTGDADHIMAVSSTASAEDPDGDGYILANPQVTGVEPSTAVPPHRYFHEFQANCSVSHTRPDDPIVYPGQPGGSHNHTFMGNTTTDAYSTTASLSAGNTKCKAPGDKSGYWMPTLSRETSLSSRWATRSSTTSRA